MESRASISSPRTTVRLVSDLPTETLLQLLTEYTQRLDDRVKTLFDRSRGRAGNYKDLIEQDDLISDVGYLVRKVENLVNKASAVRESASIDEADSLNIELRVFDAETTMRLAAALLKRVGRRSSLVF